MRLFRVMVSLAVCFSIGMKANLLNDPEFRARCRQPICMDRDGVSTYFKDIFNLKGYGSLCIEHLVDFLEFADKTAQPLSFTLRMMELFHGRMKEALWINPYALSGTLDAFIEHTGPILEAAHKERIVAVKRSMYQAMLSRFNSLKEEPEVFMNTLAEEVLQIADNTELVRLRALLVRFIESALDKLILSPHDQQGMWDITMQIADQINTLYLAGTIIDAATVQHCYRSLVYRFIYCLETVGEHLSLETYNYMKRDIAQSTHPLLSFADMESDLVISRAQLLKDALIAAETRSRVVAAGSWVAPTKRS